MSLSIRLRTRAAAAATCLAGAFLAACSGGGSPTAGPAANPVAGNAASSVRTRVGNDHLEAAGLRAAPRTRATRAAGWILPAVKAGANLIYSGSYNSNTITFFSSKGVNPPPLGQITTGLSNPERLFVDKNLNVYATNIGNNTITAYQPGTTSPFLTISNGVSSPTGLVVGADGAVYCANVANDTVTVYPKGQTSPSLTIPIPGASPENLAIDGANNLYVSYLGGSRGSGVMEFAPGSTTGTDLNLTIGYAGAVEVDRAGNVIVLDVAVPSVDVFPPGQTTPSKTIPIKSGSPFELSLSRNEKGLYTSVEVASGFIIQLTSYPNGKRFKNKITTSAGDWPLAISPDNAL